uniref:Putative ribosomal protein S3 n=1 Tax=Helianthus annuus TaxID=4232 RepID=A0A251T726_HELAN
MNLQKEFNSVNRKLNIAITRIEKPYGNPNILAEFIAGQLKNRVSFRKAMKKAIELTEQADTKGIQVQIAGRIDGKEIARVEWIREVGFHYKPFALKLIIVPIQFEQSMGIRHQNLDLYRRE